MPPLSLNLFKYQGLDVLWSNPWNVLASYCIYNNMTLRRLSVWLTHTPHRHMKKKDQGLNPLVFEGAGIAMIHKPHALLWFQSHPSPLAVHPHTTRLPTPNTSLPANYVGRQVIQDERGLSPCRESQWVLRRCPSRPEHCCPTMQKQQPPAWSGLCDFLFQEILPEIWLCLLWFVCRFDVAS